MAQMQRTPGRHTTKRVEQPRLLVVAKGQPGQRAEALTGAHNEAVRLFGSDCGGWHVFDLASEGSAGVWDNTGGFPSGSLVTPLSWGRIDAATAQRVLEGDSAA
jgi:hypothetical protein